VIVDGVVDLVDQSEDCITVKVQSDSKQTRKEYSLSKVIITVLFVLEIFVA